MGFNFQVWNSQNSETRCLPRLEISICTAIFPIASRRLTTSKFSVLESARNSEDISQQMVRKLVKHFIKAKSRSNTSNNKVMDQI